MGQPHNPQTLGGVNLSVAKRELARRFSATREALRLTRTELCRQAGISRSAWSNWEHARNTPSIEGAIKIARSFDLSLDWIYLGDLRGVSTERANRLRAAHQMA